MPPLEGADTFRTRHRESELIFSRIASFQPTKFIRVISKMFQSRATCAHRSFKSRKQQDVKQHEQTRWDHLRGEPFLTQHRERLELRHSTRRRGGRNDESRAPLTFFLSSIWCPNMALSTGERAEAERQTEVQSELPQTQNVEQHAKQLLDASQSWPLDSFRFHHVYITEFLKFDFLHISN